MKHGKKLIREMKVFLEEKGYNPDEWLYLKNTPEKLTIQNKKDLKKVEVLEKDDPYFH